MLNIPIGVTFVYVASTPSGRLYGAAIRQIEFDGPRCERLLVRSPTRRHQRRPAQGAPSLPAVAKLISRLACTLLRCKSHLWPLRR